MLIPRRKTTAHAIATLIFDTGPLSADACAAALATIERRIVCAVMQNMRNDQQLVCADGLFALAPRLHAHFSKQGHAGAAAQPLPPPYRPETKAWSGKYNISAVARRADATGLREVRFYSGSVEETPFRGVKG